MDLSTRYLGLELPHPLMPGASPLSEELDSVRRLEDAGAAAIVMRSLFEEQLVLEQLATLQHLDAHEGSNAEARTYLPPLGEFHLGPEAYLERIQRVRRAVGVPVIGSLNGHSPGGWLDFARQIESAGAHALELNVYYLATDPAEDAAAVERQTLEMVRAVKAGLCIPVAVKLSPFYSALAHFARRLDEAGADGLVLFNRFYQPDIDVEELAVVRRLHLSDSNELPLRLRWLAILSGRVAASLAASGGVHTGLDAIKAVMSGAHAVQMVSALLRDGPARLTQARREMAEWMEEHGYDSLRQMQGSMSLERCPDSKAYERANYVEVLRSWEA